MTKTIEKPSELFYGSTVRHDLGSYIPLRDDLTMYAHGATVQSHSLPRARGASLVDPSSKNVFMLGSLGFPAGQGDEVTYIAVLDMREFFRSLHVRAGQRGGFLHKVDPSTYEELVDPIGQTKWMSLAPARVIEPPQFLSLEGAMAHGVQIYYVNDPRCLQALASGRKDPKSVIPEAVDDNMMGWLNREADICPIPFPYGSPSPPSSSDQPIEALKPIF